MTNTWVSWDKGRIRRETRGRIRHETEEGFGVRLEEGFGMRPEEGFSLRQRKDSAKTRGKIRWRPEEADGFGVNGFLGRWVLSEKEIKLSVYLLKCHRSICAKNCKITTGLLNSSRIQVKTCKSCFHFCRIEYQLYSKNIWIQKLSTETKQKFFSPGPPFFGFKHRKLCLNTRTKHAPGVSSRLLHLSSLDPLIILNQL